MTVNGSKNWKIVSAKSWDDSATGPCIVASGKCFRTLTDCFSKKLESTPTDGTGTKKTENK